MNANDITANATWLDIIPAIPLTRGTPYLAINGSRGIVLRAGGDPRLVVVRRDGCSRVHNAYLTAIRADIDDPQGFGYALRYLLAHPDRHWLNTARHEILRGQLAIIRWAEGKTTDADRIALARALAELVS